MMEGPADTPVRWITKLEKAPSCTVSAHDDRRKMTSATVFCSAMSGNTCDWSEHECALVRPGEILETQEFY